MKLWVPEQYLSQFLSFLGGEITDDILKLNQVSLTGWKNEQEKIVTQRKCH